MFIYESHSTILFLKNLSMAFELKDLVLLTYFLGLQIKYTPYGFFVHVGISFCTPKHAYACSLFAYAYLIHVHACSTLET